MVEYITVNVNEDDYRKVHVIQISTKIKCLVSQKLKLTGFFNLKDYGEFHSSNIKV